jgi:phospholipid-binding lipoprotein MlaA
MSLASFPVAILLAGAPVTATAVPADVTATSAPTEATATAVPPAVTAQPPALPVSAPDAPPPSAAAPVPPTAPSAAAAEPADGSSIIVTARKRIAADPLEGVNTVTYSTVQAVDGALIEPASIVYKSVIPEPLRDGARNLLNNLQEPVVFINFLLQLKPGRAFETLGRFAINSTIGVGGLVDVAKRRPFNMPRRPNGFAFTMGYYGIKPGAFLFLPLIGPTTVRDVIGRVLDLLVLPTVIGAPFTNPAVSTTITVVRGLDERVENDDQLKKFRTQTSDPYAAQRAFYLQNRQAEIDELRGKPRRPVTPPPIIKAPETGK